ncbi:helix-turn-helix domain-containing protein [Nocardia sp. NBC_00565]|uniref:helix-turn-helix domain-containing protein n=1 Tax=Nocardia sp. NBC_00565 TaxID=2975993 RepID=UPI003FA59E76
MSESYVRQVIHDFNAHGFGALDPKWKEGRPSKTDPSTRERICHIVRCCPQDLGRPLSMWSLSKLRDVLRINQIADLSRWPRRARTGAPKGEVRPCVSAARSATRDPGPKAAAAAPRRSVAAARRYRGKQWEAGVLGHSPYGGPSIRAGRAGNTKPACPTTSAVATRSPECRRSTRTCLRSSQPDVDRGDLHGRLESDGEFVEPGCHGAVLFE